MIAFSRTAIDARWSDIARRVTVARVKKSAAPGSSDTERSIAVRIERLRAALGDPFAEDARLGHYRTALAGADEAKNARPEARPPKAELFARAGAFLAAHEIALANPTSGDERGSWGDLCSRAFLLFDVETIARGHVRTVSALKSLEQAFFTRWNELPHHETKAFWAAVVQAGLPYVRRDLLAEIFERGRITSREHYEHAVDMTGVAVDEGLLTAERAGQLDRMIASYESTGRR